MVAFSPGLDATRSGESMTTKDGIDPLFTRRSLQRLGAHHLAGQDPHGGDDGLSLPGGAGPRSRSHGGR